MKSKERKKKFGGLGKQKSTRHVIELSGGAVRICHVIDRWCRVVIATSLKGWGIVLATSLDAPTTSLIEGGEGRLISQDADDLLLVER